jgi:hypothetical protein
VAASKHHLALATAARDGAITVFNIEKQSMLASRSIDTKEDGAPMELLFNDSGHPPLLFYTSAFGVTVGWVSSNLNDDFFFSIFTISPSTVYASSISHYITAVWYIGNSFLFFFRIYGSPATLYNSRVNCGTA